MERPAVVYHNPSMIRTGRWAGERGRQLVAAMQEAGGRVRAVPSTAAAETSRPGPGMPRRLLARLPRQWRGPLVTVRLLQRGTVNTVKWSWRLWRRLRSSPPDVLLARYHEYEWTPLIVARLLRRPLVLEVHSSFALEGTLRGRRPSRVARWMDRLFWRRADLVWVHTPALRDIVAAGIDDPGKIRLIPFGIADPEMPAEPGTGGRIEVAFAGSFYPWHGVDELLEAFSRARMEAPNMHLTLIGDGVSRDDAVGRAAAPDLADATSFTGWLDRDALHRQLQQSHIGVAPYHDIGQSYFEPVKVLDYQMAGLAIVASDAGHIPNMAEDGEDAVLVPPGDVDALAAALVKLAADPALRDELGRAARERARHVEETAAAVLELCRDAADL